jgi:predicted transcriptional regulator
MHGKKVDKDQDDIDFLKDLLLETSLSISEIAKELGWTIPQVNKKINSIGLTWLKDSRKKMSRGQTALTAAMQ